MPRADFQIGGQVDGPRWFYLRLCRILIKMADEVFSSPWRIREPHGRFGNQKGNRVNCDATNPVDVACQGVMGPPFCHEYGTGFLRSRAVR